MYINSLAVCEYSPFRILIKVSDTVDPDYIPLIDHRFGGGCGLFKVTQLGLNELTFYHNDLLRKIEYALTNLTFKSNRSIDCIGLIFIPLENTLGVSLRFTTDKIGEYYYRTYEFDSEGRMVRSYEEPKEHFEPPYMLKLIEKWTRNVRKEYRALEKG